MRAFLAFEVADGVIERIRTAEEGLGRTGADVTLVSKENLHFTVKFLGDVHENVVGEIDRRMKDLSLKGTEVRVQGIGVFPDPQRPRVVWAGVAPQDGPSLVALSKTIIETLDGIGRPEDHDFRPHITIGRVRTPRNREALAEFVERNKSLDFGATTIGTLKLKSSVLTPQGPIYSDVREYLLS